ncbi:MAG: LytTR family DNA-binding domain-containing protein [Candidatus Aminicenantes bacterium]
MFKILKQPYPICSEVSCFLKCALIVCPFVYVFLLIFQPFGLNFLEPALKHPVFLGYAAVCYLMLGLNIFILPWLLKRFFDEAKWTALKQILWEVWTVFTIGAGNYFFTHRIVDYLSDLNFGTKDFLWFQKITLAIAIIPVIVLTLLTQIYLLKKNLKAAEEINEKIGVALQDAKGIDSQVDAVSKDAPKEAKAEPLHKQKFVLKSDKHRETLEVDPDDIICIESVGNYVEVTYLKGKEKAETTLLRSTLRRIERQLKGFPFLFKCHRGFIVNINKIQRANGNAQGYKLHLEGIDKAIPVARSYLKKFRENIRR